MIDVNAIVRAFLLTDATLKGLVESRLYAGKSVPPERYKPKDKDGNSQPCICFQIRGGSPDYDDALLKPSIQFKCYAATPLAAGALYRALVDALHNASSADILYAEQETLGADLREPATGWPFVLTHFLIMCRQS